MLISIALIFYGFPNIFFSNEKLSESQVVEKFVNNINKEYESFFSINSDDVLIDKKTIDNNISSDLMVYFDGRCGASLGCEIEVYLCLHDSALCDSNQYCYAGIFYEGEIVTKGKELVCKE